MSMETCFKNINFKILMRLAENESRRVGMKFEALVELSQERIDAG
jgi:hypothetical protein